MDGGPQPAQQGGEGNAVAIVDRTFRKGITRLAQLVAGSNT